MASELASNALPAVRPPSGPPAAREDGPAFEHGDERTGPPPTARLAGFPIPYRLARLGGLLAAASLLFAMGGFAGWALLGAEAESRGPWPLVLGVSFGLGLLGAGCGLVSLTFGSAARRQAVSALCVSLLAPLAVGILALALFFASTSSTFL
jgi:hypothetical protein